VDENQALARLQRYCAIQERCSSDAARKLRELGIPREKADRVMGLLKKEGFIDDLRFSRSFVSGKFRINRWGRLRIIAALSAKHIPSPIILQSLAVIEEDRYREAIRELTIKKNTLLKNENGLIRRNKIISFVTGKGFETDLVIPIVNKIVKYHG
jgi:regulatory protein